MADESIKGKIYDIQGFSVHDGPGVRTTVFLKGCPLHCLWCHSPESQSFRVQMSYTPLRCVGTDLCGECLKVCPAPGALTVSEPVGAGKDAVRKTIWDSRRCTNCGACAEVCYPGALSLVGKDYTVDEVMAIIRKDKGYFGSTDGGVTVSGGEALSQIDFTEALLRACRAEGIHTALDTTGFSARENIDRVLPWTDLFLYDLKNMDSAAHKRGTGVPNEQILDNARYIAAQGGKLQIRIPVIPGFNDSAENLTQTAAFCSGLGGAVTLVQLLPYHNLGASKYERIQKHNPMPDTVTPPDDETMQRIRGIFEEYALPVTIH